MVISLNRISTKASLSVTTPPLSAQVCFGVKFALNRSHSKSLTLLGIGDLPEGIMMRENDAS